MKEIDNLQPILLDTDKFDKIKDGFVGLNNRLVACDRELEGIKRQFADRAFEIMQHSWTNPADSMSVDSSADVSISSSESGGHVADVRVTKMVNN